MNIKEELIRLKKKLLKEKDIKKNSVDLDDKVEEFLIWYSNNYNYEDKVKSYNKMKRLIEKWAIWYELKYPDYKITENEMKAITGYDTHSFISLLPYNERWFLKKYKYPEIVYINERDHFHLNRNGIIKGCDVLCNDYEYEETNIFNGKSLKDASKILMNMININNDSEVFKVLNEKNKRKYLKEEFLDAVMYHIIEHGGETYGPLRGFEFAKEFKRNIEIPLIYGIESNKGYTRNLVNEYIKLGGRTNLECIYDYFTCKENKLDYVMKTIEHFLKYNKDYTDEEHELHQRLVNAISRKK